jgi:hypothetical protein
MLAKQLFKEITSLPSLSDAGKLSLRLCATSHFGVISAAFVGADAVLVTSSIKDTEVETNRDFHSYHSIKGTTATSLSPFPTQTSDLSCYVVRARSSVSVAVGLDRLIVCSLHRAASACS